MLAAIILSMVFYPVSLPPNALGEPAVDRFISLPGPRTRTGAALMDGTIYVFGGISEGRILDSILTIDPLKGKVAELDSKLPHPIDNPTVFTDGKRAFITGGKPILTAPDTCVDVQNRNLTIVSSLGVVEHHVDFFPYGIEGASVVSDGSCFYLVGACMCSSAPGKNGIIRFDPETLSMEISPNVLPYNVSGSVSVWHDEKIYVFGGKTDGGRSVDTVVRYTIGERAEILPTHLPEALFKTGVVVTKSGLFIIGGEGQGGPVDRVTFFDLESEKLRDSGIRLTYPRASRAVVGGNERAYIIGGDTFDGASDSVETLRLETANGGRTRKNTSRLISGNVILLGSIVGSVALLTLVALVYYRDIKRSRTAPGIRESDAGNSHDKDGERER